MDITLWIEVILFIVLMVLSDFFFRTATSRLSLANIQPEYMHTDGNSNPDLIERLPSRPRRGVSRNFGCGGRQFAT